MASPGELLMQGMTNFGQSMGQGIADYAKVKKIDATTTGQIEGYLTSALANPALLPDDGQKLLEKFKSGSANLKDKTQLLGALTTARAVKEQDMAYQQQQQAAQLQQYQLQASARQAAALNSYMPSPGGMAPQGAAPQAPAGNIPAMLARPGATNQPAAANIMAPQSAGGLNDFIGKYVRATGAAPAPEITGEYLKSQLSAEQPIGVVYTGPNLEKGSLDANGSPTEDVYNMVYKNPSNGAIRIDNAARKVPYNAPAPAPRLDPQTFEQLGRAAMAIPNGPVTPAANGAVTDGRKPIRVLTPDIQKTISEVNGRVQDLQENADRVQALKKAAALYMSSPLSGNRANAMTGTDTGLKFRQLVFGDSSGKTMQGFAGNLIGPLLQQLKGNGRITQNEFNMATSAIPQTEDPNDTIAAKIPYMERIYNWVLDRSMAEKNNLAAGMSPTDAQNAAMEQVKLGKIPDFSSPAAAPAKIPVTLGPLQINGVRLKK